MHIQSEFFKQGNWLLGSNSAVLIWPAYDSFHNVQDVHVCASSPVWKCDDVLEESQGVSCSLAWPFGLISLQCAVVRLAEKDQAFECDF